jgi:glycosyltransferase involved in cell wall biosynthesis
MSNIGAAPLEPETPGNGRFRLLVVSSDTYPPTRVDVTVLFVAELAGRGHHIDWILQSEAPCPHAYVTPWGGGQAWVGATDLGHSLFRRVKKHVLGIVNDLKIFSRLRLGRYDAIEVKDKFLSGIFAMVASRLYRTKFIYWLSYPYPEHYLLSARDGVARYPSLYVLRGWCFKWLLYRWLLPAADHVFVQSEEMRQDVAAKGIPLHKLTAIPMGVSVAMCTAKDLSRSRKILPAAVPCVIYLGALNKVRRLDFLIRAFALVRTIAPSARLYIVGRGDDPSDEALLTKEAARLNLGSAVVFVGQLPQPEALQYAQEADICVSPLYPTPVLRVASPTKLVEYMALGKAVVANDHPEQKRVIDASGAGYCVPYDEQAFADAVVNLLQDPNGARAMGQRGRQFVLEHRAYGVIADAVEKQLWTIVNGRC